MALVDINQIHITQ